MGPETRIPRSEHYSNRIRLLNNSQTQIRAKPLTFKKKKKTSLYQNAKQAQVQGEGDERRQSFCLLPLNPRLGAGRIQTVYFHGLQAEVFLPAIVFISPKEQAPRGRRAGRPGTKPTPSSTWARAGARRGRGRGGAPRPAGPPARRPQLPGSAAPPPPPAGQSPASAARAHEPRRHQAERDPTARAWHRARTRTARAGQSAAGHAQPAGSLARGPHA